METHHGEGAGDPELLRLRAKRFAKRVAAPELHWAGPQLLARVPAGRREEGDPTGAKTLRKTVEPATHGDNMGSPRSQFIFLGLLCRSQAGRCIK